ncbi:MAG: hypothetical protein CM1200mP28_07650 [Deltaproteobacteria bacterium]|nr:MAG: hypothetical protein CM1200mP28_07650 [Deltaproteobacteria bacterium]
MAYNPYRSLRNRKRQFSELYIKSGKNNSGRIREIQELAEELGITLNEVPGNKLTEMCPGAVHQGVVLRVYPAFFSHLCFASPGKRVNCR